MTLIEVDLLLTELNKAYAAAITGKSYSINTGDGTSRNITRNEPKSLRVEILYYERERAKIEGGQLGLPRKFATPMH